MRKIQLAVIIAALGCGGGAAPAETPQGMGTAGSASAAGDMPGPGGVPEQPQPAGQTPTPQEPAQGQAGAAAPAPEDPSSDPGGSDPPEPGTDMPQEWPDPRGGCPELDSGFPGDEACIAPPAPGEGIQIHIGPDDYTDPVQVTRFALGSGREVSECVSYHTPNAEGVYYQGWTLSGRPGTHHIFNSMLTVEVTDGGDFHVCVDAGLGTSPARLGSLPAAAKPYMPRTKVAPENAGLGRLIPAKTPAEADMHYFNFGDAEVLREFWLNIYFIPRADVTEESLELRGMGGLSWAALPIAPGTDQVYRYECPINADGRITGMAGHFHKHGERETVHIRRASGERQKIFEMYDYTNAALFAFDSISTNPMLADGVDGAYSGRLDVSSGDVLEWECHVNNDGSVPLTYSNSVEAGEMCNVFGVSVGVEINCLLP